MKSGMLKTLLRMSDQAHPGADAAEGDGDGQAHGEHRAEGEDQHDDGEGEADELGLPAVRTRRGAVPPGSTSRPSMAGACVGDRLAEGRRLGQSSTSAARLTWA